MNHAPATEAPHAQLLDALLALRNSDGGWPYYHGRKSRLEPTSWALLATGLPFDTTPLASWVGAGGLLVEPSTPHANFAFNALAALAMRAAPTASSLLAGVIDGLVLAKGEIIDRVSGAAPGQDSTLQGWSWMAGTFSWVEPTAWCTLALKQAATSDAAGARIDVGERLLRDRVGADGGWNYGNAEVFGRALPSHVPPTAAAVLALQDHPGDATVTRALSRLAAQGPVEGSTTALALTTLALRICGRDASDVSLQLGAHAPAALAFGNAAAVAMAACALGPPARLSALQLSPGTRRG